MEAAQKVLYDPNLLSRITSFLDDHFDLLSLSQTSKCHRQLVLQSVQKITVRNLLKIEKLSQNATNVTSLNINLLDIKLTQEVFDDLMSHLPDLETSEINPSDNDELNLRTTGKLSQLRVLSLHSLQLNDEVAEVIGRGCSLFEELAIKGFVRFPLSKEDWSNLVFGSTHGLRRLSIAMNGLKEDVFLLFLQCSNLTSLSVDCFNFEFSNPRNDNFEYLRVELKNLRKLCVSLKARVDDRLSDYITDYITDLCNKIINCGACLEVFDSPNVNYETVRTLCERMPLRSLTLYPHVSRLFEEQFISTNPNFLSFKILKSSDTTNNAIMEKIAEVEGIRKRQSNAEISIVPKSFLQGDHFFDIELNFGVFEHLSSKMKFLQDFTLELSDSIRWEDSYSGLEELFSICTLLKKVCVKARYILGKDNFQRPNLCLALEALSNCHKLEDLSAPVGDKTLSKILRGVKGLRRLSIDGPMEVFSDESALQLMTNSPFLRYFQLIALPISYHNEVCGQKSGVTQKGLEALSNCSQLQTLELWNFGRAGLCLKCVAEKCLWLNDLFLICPDKEVVENSEAVQVLKDRGCHVEFGDWESQNQF